MAIITFFLLYFLFLFFLPFPPLPVEPGARQGDRSTTLYRNADLIKQARLLQYLSFLLLVAELPCRVFGPPGIPQCLPPWAGFQLLSVGKLKLVITEVNMIYILHA